MKQRSHPTGNKALALFLARLFGHIASVARLLSLAKAHLFWRRLAAKIAPFDALSSGLLGSELIKNGNAQDALLHLLASKEGHVTKGAHLLAAAHGFFKLGELHHCKETFLRASKHAGKDVRVLIETLNFLALERHSADEAAPLYERAKQLEPEHPELTRLQGQLLGNFDEQGHTLRSVIIGTTGLCNASCPHCPTGKPQTEHVPRVPMSMSLFEKLVDDIVDCNITVLDGMNFGLFGDGLVDPFVLQRARYLKQRLPSLPLHINTNAAAYNRRKHSELFSFVSSVNLHCESLMAERYNVLMSPLRLERTWPKIEMLMRDFAGKMTVTIPISKVNHDEQRAMLNTFMRMGANNVSFAPLSARCAKDQTNFERMAISPKQIQCPPELLADLTVDCDGTVVACCNDFSRELPVGNVANQSMIELLEDSRRQEMRRQLHEKRHNEISTCSRCRADVEVQMDACF